MWDRPRDGAGMWGWERKPVNAAAGCEPRAGSLLADPKEHTACMDKPCFAGAGAPREAEQLGSGNGERRGSEISRELEKVPCPFLPRACAQHCRSVWPALPRTGLRAQPGVSLYWTGKENQACFSNCPLQHFQFYQMDFISPFKSNDVRKRQPVYSSIFNN